MQHLISKISTWTVLATSTAVLAACGGGHGGSGSMNGPTLSTSGNMTCTVGQICEFAVGGSGAPFHVNSSNTAIAPNFGDLKPGSYQFVTGALPDGKKTDTVTLSVFPEGKTWVAGAGHSAQIDITIQAAGGTGASGSLVAIPDANTPGGPNNSCSTTGGIAGSNANCIASQGNGTLLFTFIPCVSSLSYQSSGPVTFTHVFGDWDFVGGAGQYTTPAPGSCKFEAPILVDPLTSNQVANVKVEYVDDFGSRHSEVYQFMLGGAVNPVTPAPELIVAPSAGSWIDFNCVTAGVPQTLNSSIALQGLGTQIPVEADNNQVPFFVSATTDAGPEFFLNFVPEGSPIPLSTFTYPTIKRLNVNAFGSTAQSPNYDLLKGSEFTVNMWYTSPTTGLPVVAKMLDSNNNKVDIIGTCKQ